MEKEFANRLGPSVGREAHERIGGKRDSWIDRQTDR